MTFRHQYIAKSGEALDQPDKCHMRPRFPQPGVDRDTKAVPQAGDKCKRMTSLEIISVL